jgi:hypothetical protein
MIKILTAKVNIFFQTSKDLSVFLEPPAKSGVLYFGKTEKNSKFAA